MFLWRWKSSLIARNSIWNILFPDQSIKRKEEEENRDKETRKKILKDERYKENELVKNTLSVVLNCEFKLSVFWMIVEYRMVFKQIGIIFFPSCEFNTKSEGNVLNGIHFSGW